MIYPIDSPFEWLMLALLISFCLVQIIIHFINFIPFVQYKKNETSVQKLEGVSIVISARSEYDYLTQLIPKLTEQNYPDFEIVVVDDASWDKSKELIEQFEIQYPNVKGVFVTEDMKKQTLGKKLALTLGIKAAKNNIILLTDADCVPLSDKWIYQMALPFHQNKDTEIVLGYSPFYKTKTFTNFLSRIDNLWTAILYLSSAIKKNPYMGVGRNLSYKKSLFMNNKGFANHLHIVSGDDDLFVQDNANSKNTAVCFNPESFVYSHSKSNISDWIQQKTRHNHVGKYYKSKHQFKLGFIIFSHAMVWFLFIANLLIGNNWFWSILILILYWSIKFPIIFNSFKRLKNSKMAFYLPLFDLFYLFYNMIFGYITLIYKQKKW